MVLNSQPTSDVKITITNDSNTSTNPTTLTFTSANWNIAQTVSVSAVDDNQVEGNHTGNITHTVSSTDSNYNGLTVNDVTVNITDNDTPGFTVVESNSSTTVTEDGSTDTFTVVLNSQPTSDVVINIANPNTGEATVSTTSLTFTSANWDTVQTVTVTGVDDNLVDDTQTIALTLSVDDANSDDNFDVIANQTVNVDTTDNDTAQITIVVINNAAEPSTNGLFTVSLSKPSTTDTVVSYTVSGNGSSGNDYLALSNSVTIKAGETTATIDVSVIDDNLVEADETVIVTLDSITSGNSNIGIGNSNQATLTINSDDVAATAPILVNNTLTINEDDTVTFSSSNLSATDADSDDANLTFTVSNVTGGTFEVDGVVNNSFTQQQITDGKVKFIDDGNENAPSYDITVSDGNLTDSGSATVNFTNVNDAPTEITLSNSSVAENDIAAVISDLTVTDVDSSNFTYSVNDNRFEVVNSQLKLKDGVSLDFETETSINLEITVTDDGNPNQILSKNFAITVTDVIPTVSITAIDNTATESGDGQNIYFPSNFLRHHYLKSRKSRPRGIFLSLE